MENDFQVPGFETDGIHLIPQWFYGREGRMERERLRFYNPFPNPLATHCWGKIYKSPSLHALPLIAMSSASQFQANQSPR